MNTCIYICRLRLGLYTCICICICICVCVSLSLSLYIYIYMGLRDYSVVYCCSGAGRRDLALALLRDELHNPLLLRSAQRGALSGAGFTKQLVITFESIVIHR